MRDEFHNTPMKMISPGSGTFTIVFLPVSGQAGTSLSRAVLPGLFLTGEVRRLGSLDSARGKAT